MTTPQPSTLPSGQIATVNAGVFPPSPIVRDWLWRIVVLAFVLGLLAVIVAEIAFVFVFPNSATPQVWLTLFTATVGFLGGLFAPSPFADNHTHPMPPAGVQPPD